MDKTTVNCTTLLKIVIVAIAVACIYVFRADHIMLNVTVGSNLYNTFQSDSMIPIRCVIVSVITHAIVISLTLMSEKFFSNSEQKTDQFERASISIILLVCSLPMLFLIYAEKISIIFLASHIVQSTGIFFVVTALSTKLFPTYFRVVPSQTLIGLAAVLAFAGHSTPFKSSSLCLSSFVLGIVGFSLYGYSLFSWVREQRILEK